MYVIASSNCCVSPDEVHPPSCTVAHVPCRHSFAMSSVEHGTQAFYTTVSTNEIAGSHSGGSLSQAAPLCSGHPLPRGPPACLTIIGTPPLMGLLSLWYPRMTVSGYPPLPPPLMGLLSMWYPRMTVSGYPPSPPPDGITVDLVPSDDSIWMPPPPPPLMGFLSLTSVWMYSPPPDGITVTLVPSDDSIWIPPLPPPDGITVDLVPSDDSIWMPPLPPPDGISVIDKHLAVFPPA